MNPSIEAARRERIDAVLALAAARLAADQRTPSRPSPAPTSTTWMPTTWRRARPRTCSARCCRAGSSAPTAHPGTTRLRVISPSLAEQGWASRHTVIEVVNDDMPFLVDTTTMEINRQGLTLHLIVHPVLVVERDAHGPAAVAARAARGRARHARGARVVDAHRGRPPGRPAQRAELAAGLERVLDDVRAAVRDWQPMRAAAARGHRRAGAAAADGASRRWPRNAAPSCSGWPTTT